MAMTTQIDLLTGATPTVAAVTSKKWNRVDTQSGTTAIPTPTATGTNFSFVGTFQMEITATGALTMTNIMVGKVAAESTTGTKLWHRTDHAQAAYTQATAAPAATADNNVTAPAMNGTNAAVTALPLISAPPTAYAAGGFSATGRVGNLVEIALGIDATNTTAGTTVATPTVRWSWTEG